MANENWLIDANALADAFRKYMAERFDRERCVSEENCNACDRECIWRRIVKDAPTVDAVEVVHGRWIEHIEMGAMNNHYECSACHWKTPSFTIAKGSNYCPNCGAKMDGDGNEV